MVALHDRHKASPESQLELDASMPRAAYLTMLLSGEAPVLWTVQWNFKLHLSLTGWCPSKTLLELLYGMPPGYARTLYLGCHSRSAQVFSQQSEQGPCD